MLSAQKIANNIALASRSFMRSAYVAQVTRNPDPINQKLPSDHIIPDIIPEQDAPPIDNPASTKWSNRNTESENLSVNAMSRPNLKEPENLLKRKSPGNTRSDDELVDASNRFLESSSDASEISSSEKLRGSQSQIGEVPSREEWDASSDLKSTAKEYMSDIKDKAHDIKENVKEKTNDYVEDLSEKASAAKTKQDEWMRKSSESYEDMKQNAKEKSNETMEIIKEMPHRIKEKVKDFTGIGKD